MDRRRVVFLLAGVLVWSMPILAGARPSSDEDSDAASDHHSSAIGEEVLPLAIEALPKRPKPIIDLGNKYLVSGTLKPGFRIPGGAVWQPSLLGFGTLRTAVQSATQNDGEQRTELAVRLDLGFNLQLTGSERLVVGFRVLGDEGYTGYRFSPTPAPGEDRWMEDVNASVQTLFFEGDVGELFPALDRADSRRADVGFSLGRQGLFFQEGMLISDTLDGLGLTRNTLQPAGTSNFRVTFFGAAGNVNRNDNVEDGSDLLAIFTSADLRRSTIDADLVWVTGGEQQSDETGLLQTDQLAIGISSVQRIGKINTSFRLLGSLALEDEVPGLVTDGALFFSEVSWTPHYSQDLFYATFFVSAEEMTSAARDPTTGMGPLARAGISFGSPGIGSLGSALSPRANEVAGGAFGFQKFMHETRRQVIYEVAARLSRVDGIPDSAAGAVRYQAAFGRRSVFVVDGFVAYYDEPAVSVLGSEFETTRFGARVEYQLRF